MIAKEKHPVGCFYLFLRLRFCGLEAFMPTSAPRGKVARESARIKMRGSNSVPLASVWGRASARSVDISVNEAPVRIAFR